MGKRYIYTFRCCVCGRFTDYKSDYSVPFGGYEDYEPPDEEYYCKKCIKDMINWCLKTGFVPQSWIPAKWEIKVAHKLGFRRAGPKGAAWSHWCRELPKDNYGGEWVWHEGEIK